MPRSMPPSFGTPHHSRRTSGGAEQPTSRGPLGIRPADQMKTRRLAYQRRMLSLSVSDAVGVLHDNVLYSRQICRTLGAAVMDMGLLDAVTLSLPLRNAVMNPMMRRRRLSFVDCRVLSLSLIGLTLMQGWALGGFWDVTPSVMCEVFRTHATLYRIILPNITFY